VAVGDFESEADEDGGAREREETKRLLYVAMTRARDRLYLGSALKDGRIQPGRGSLAEVLPPTLLERFGDAATATTVEWVAGSGLPHSFRVCVAAEGDAPIEKRSATAIVDADFAAITAVGAVRTTARVVIADPSASALRGIGASDLLIGTVVHRLLQRCGLDSAEPTAARAIALQVLRPEEIAVIEDLDLFLSDAVGGYMAICSQPDVRALYGAGDRLHEVPFTLWHEGAFIRGSIDCIVRATTDAGMCLTILEFKTGRPRAEHQRQLDLYTRAMQETFPDATVDARLVYAAPAKT
jgi:ATP-dependent helicase/nuclease subunit A